MRLAGKFYLKSLEGAPKGSEGAVLKKAMSGLRSSLRARRPIPLSDVDFLVFLFGLPSKDQRVRALTSQTQYETLTDLVAPSSK